MPVIAMTREMGSTGRDMALKLAEDLGLKLVQHEVVEHVADRMHVGASAVNRFLEGEAGLLERWNIDRKRVSLFTAEEIFDLRLEGQCPHSRLGRHASSPPGHPCSVDPRLRADEQSASRS